MKIKVLLILIISLIVYSVPPFWEFQTTENNHSVFILSEANPRINTTPLVEGDYIGVFYENDGLHYCCGYTAFIPNTTLSLSAWGDDNSTPEKDGLANGETFKWKIFQASTGFVYSANATYAPIGGPLYNQTSNYATDGISGITDLIGQGVSIEEQKPSSSILIKNYPNPFNPETVISFELKGREYVKLAVYNAKGELIRSLVNGILNPGKHVTSFNASDLNSGIYYYIFTAGEEKHSGKMVLVK
ncbi:MAG: T9SS type A sorting domain-containing protein [Candidatus Delongbacteria bacterium]|nr:T9SS type A sorting domain-containing protein [Candidatus Delongbacteria bacterium]MBN2835833.1 T9SS type A sorting domain-containing protein [Candidatus Delongbacteria bacterium]